VAILTAQAPGMALVAWALQGRMGFLHRVGGLLALVIGLVGGNVFAVTSEEIRDSLGRSGPVKDSWIECLKWKAWYNLEPPDEDDRLHVAGTVACKRSDIKLKLEPANEGIVDDSELFVLRLSFWVPPESNDEYVERDIEWADSVGLGIARVEIRGDCQATVPVEVIR
jgi:hypothetical protein